MTRARALAAVALLAGVVLLQPAHDAAATSHHRAAVVVRYDTTHIDRMCVFFDTATISGLDLLERSGLTFAAERSSLGSAICNIDGTGCKYPSSTCFCKYPSFWGYWTREPHTSAWQFSDVGARDREVSDGAVDGWSFGRNGKPAPPNVAFTDVCTADVKPATSRTSAPRAAAPDGKRASPASYVGFAAFAAIFVLGGLGAVALRSRRSAR